jgi:hypothetical protein
VVDSTSGWPIDHLFPHDRKILSPVAIYHGYLLNSENRKDVHINERVHWSAITKRQSRRSPPYSPRNLPQDIPEAKIAAMTVEERELLDTTGWLTCDLANPDDTAAGRSP